MNNKHRYWNRKETINPKHVRGVVASVRISFETEDMIEEMLLKHADLYLNKSSLIECAIRRMYKWHKQQKTSQYFEMVRGDNHGVRIEG